MRDSLRRISAEISHFVRKVERQTFIWTYQRPAPLLLSLFKDLGLNINIEYSALEFMTIHYSFGLMFRSILCWVAPLCVKFHFVTRGDRDKLRERDTESLVCFMEM